jgi:hypothetical protein
MRLCSTHLEVDIDVVHGAEIRSVARPGGPNALAWHDWAAPAPADESSTYGSSQLDWLSRYRGGWQELFPNAGAACEYRGVPLAFHGEASLSQWEVVHQADDQCELRVAARLPLVLSRRMSLAPDRPAVLIEETVTNVSDLEVPYLWGHHPVFPAREGARIDLPGGTVRPEPADRAGLDLETSAWPNATADGVPCDLSEVPAETQQRLLYVDDLPAAWVALRQPAGEQGVAMAWDASAFGVLWLWLLNGTDEFPWYGRARMLGIEPQTAWPYDGVAAAHARGAAPVIGPRERRSSWLTLVLIDSDGGPVTAVSRGGRVDRGTA